MEFWLHGDQTALVQSLPDNLKRDHQQAEAYRQVLYPLRGWEAPVTYYATAKLTYLSFLRPFDNELNGDRERVIGWFIKGVEGLKAAKDISSGNR